MSGFEGLAVACNVLQVTAYALQALSLCKSIYKNEQPQPELLQIGKAFDEAFVALEESLPRDEILAELSTNDAALLKLGRDCHDTSKQLQHQLQRPGFRVKAGHWQCALSATCKLLWRANTIKELRQRLEEQQQGLQSRILIDLRKRYEVAASHQTENFKELEDSLKSAITKATNDVSRFAHLNSQKIQEYHDSITTQLQELQAQQQDLETEKHLEKVLDSLFFPEMMSRQQNVADAYMDTFRWIFARQHHRRSSDSENSDIPAWDNLQDWLEHGSGIYWISGKLGSGKSTLLRLVYDDDRTAEALATWARGKELTMPAFFFWKAGQNPLQRTFLGFLRGIVYQILERNRRFANPIVPLNTTRIHEWTEKRLQEILFNIFRRDPNDTCTCIFIDGLDELTGNAQSLVDVLKMFSSIEGVKIVVSSRRDAALERNLDTCPQLRMEDLNRPDINAYIQNKLYHCTRSRDPDDVDCTECKNSDDVSCIESLDADDVNLFNISELVHRIQAKAQGVFLWVSLAVESLCSGIANGDSYGLLLERLEGLPDEIDNLYTHMLMAIHRVYRGRVARYIRIIMLANQLVNQFKRSMSSVTILTMSLIDLGDEIPFEHHLGLSESQLKQRCRRTHQQVIAQCHGFLCSKRLKRWPSINDRHISKPPDIAESYSLSKYDNQHAMFQFSHRTVVDYFEIHQDILCKMEEKLPKKWNASDALARAFVRRMEVLPWIEEMVRQDVLWEPYLLWEPHLLRESCLLREPWICLRYLLLAEQISNKPFIDSVEHLGRMTKHVVGNSACSDIFVPEVAGARYSGPPFGIDGICARWGLMHYVRHRVESESADINHLLMCSTVGAAWWEMPWDAGPNSSQLDTIRFLLGKGANLNAKYSGYGMAFRDTQSSPAAIASDLTGECSPWTFILSWLLLELRSTSPSSVCNTLQILLEFVNQGGDLETLNTHTRVPMSMHHSRSEYSVVDLSIAVSLRAMMSILRWFWGNNKKACGADIEKLRTMQGLFSNIQDILSRRNTVARHQIDRVYCKEGRVLGRVWDTHDVLQVLFDEVWYHDFGVSLKPVPVNAGSLTWHLVLDDGINCYEGRPPQLQHTTDFTREIFRLIGVNSSIR